MKKNLIFLLLAFAVNAASIFAASPIEPRAETVVAFVNVSIVPMDTERVLPNQTVIVRNGLIAEIGDAKRVKVPNAARRIDGAGKFLIPGLTDMHVHLMSDDDEFPDALAEDELRIMIANGVTTIRLMTGTPEQLALRARSARGEIIAPTMYVASPQFIGKKSTNAYVVTTETEGRESVRKAKRDGYDYLKIDKFES
jgi:imidazolonepropionase-like amidohydrolase